MFTNTTQKLLNQKLICLEDILKSDVLVYYWPISQTMKKHLKLFVENIIEDKRWLDKISIILTTPWGQAEWAEDFVNILRHHYKYVDFIIPDYAMSAWTILVMSWDEIYMDYASSLWPIDPQIQWPDWKFLPASGYLDKINELITKERTWTVLTVSELNIILAADIWRLKFIEQSKNLTVKLLKEWLVKYKFKDWECHEGTFHAEKKWKTVTEDEKKERAEEIAVMLWDVDLWNTHGRSINMWTLTGPLKLKIEDIWKNPELQTNLREYYDLMITYIWSNEMFIQTRNFI